MTLRERKSVRLILAADRIVSRVARVPKFLGLLATSIALYFACAFLGRFGEPAVVVSLVAAALLGVFFAFVLRRAGVDEERELQRALTNSYGRLRPAILERASRGLKLVARLAQPEHSREGSLELAEHHLYQLLDSIPAEQLLTLARKRGRRMGRVAWLALAGLGVVYVGFGLAISEGTLALFATGGEAPLSIAYGPSVITAVVPEYTRLKPSERFLFRDVESLPAGSEVRVHFTPQVEREFFVRYAGQDHRLESDGHGSLVGRFVIKESGTLVLGARLGKVLVRDSARYELVVIRDKSPEILLEGAPKSLPLAEMTGGETLRYHASDDYGLTEVSLVMKTGQRQERKRLAELDGIETSYEGVYHLAPNHPFLVRAYLPVTVSIEAKDGDRFAGPNSALSEAFTILPPAIGEMEAEGARPLYAFRASVARALGEYLESSEANRSERLRSQIGEALREVQAKRTSLERFSQRELQFLDLAVERALTKLDAESADNLLLSSDVLVQSYSQDKAGKVSKKLGALVRELSSALNRLREEERPLDLQLASELRVMAERSARYLSELGRLGRDLGGVASGDLARVKRLFDSKEYLGAERAALHLATRLERGSPSFGSKSAGGGGRGGGESGVSSSGAEGGGGRVSEAPTEFEQSAQAREKLAQDHAKQLSELERLLQEARQAAAGDPQMSRKLSELAQKVREGSSMLPSSGPEGTTSGDAARARQSAEAMADALSEGDLKRALGHGRDAARNLAMLKKHLAERGGRVSQEEAQRAEDAVSEALRDAEQLRSELAKSTASKLGESKEALAKKEGELAQRVKQLLERSGQWLSEDEKEEMRSALEAMEKATRDLRDGGDDAARDSAERAQAALERALASDSAKKERSDGEPSDEEGNGREQKMSGDVPATAEDRAKEFRRRVREGLSRGSGNLAPFVAKYAGELE